jgi:DNA-binding IclR family transcriptional regulator
LLEVRRRGWAQSVGEREPGVASVSAPVRDASGAVVAAVSVSGPIDRMGRRPGARWAADLLAAADALQARL